MKPGRQTIINEIITTQDIETQNQLLSALADRGIRSTQATLSRDIKDMRLVKETTPDGRSRYVRSAEVEVHINDTRLKKILKESILSYDLAQNLMVIKTLPGLAPAACSAIDKMEIPGLVGTIAGDDTAFIAMKDNASAEGLFDSIHEFL